MSNDAPTQTMNRPQPAEASLPPIPLRGVEDGDSGFEGVCSMTKILSVVT